MAITTFSSRQFNQDASRAKNATRNGPVIITDRGRPAHVLLSIEEYYKIINEREDIVELLAMPSATGLDFDPPRLDGKLHRSADLG
jgi:prevent-host-death family protein